MFEDLDIFTQQPLRRYYSEEDIIDLNRQLENAQVQGNLPLERITYKKLGAACWSRGNHRMAVKHFEKFLPMIRTTGDKKAEGNASWNLAIAYHSLAQFSEATRYYEQSLRISKELDKKKCAETMYENLGNAYRSHGKYQKAIHFYKLSLSTAEKEGDKKKEVRLRSSLGLAFKMQGMYKEAIRYFDESLHIANQIRDKVAKADAYSNSGEVYLELENYHEALMKFKKSLDISKSLGNTKEVSYALFYLGNVNFLLRKYDVAIKYHTECLNIAEEMDQQGRAYGGLGDVQLSLGKYDDAIEHYQTSLEISITMEVKNDERHAHDRLGDVHYSLNGYDEAIEHYQQSLNTAEEMNDKKNEGRAHGKLGRTFQASENYDKAIEQYNYSILAANLTNDTMAVGKVNAALGDVYFLLKDYNKAKRCYNVYLEKAKQSRDLKNKQNAYNVLGNFYHSQGKYREAIGYHELSLNVAGELKDLKGKGQAHMLLGDDNRLLKNYNHAFQCYKKSLMIYAKIRDQENKRIIYGKLGFLCQITNKYKEAIEYYKQALKVKIPANDREGERKLNANLGVAYQSLHEYELAIEHHEKNLGIAIEMSDEKAQVYAECNLGKTYMSSGNYLEALAYFEKNLITAESNEDSGTNARVNAYANLGNVHYALGQYTEARQYYRKYLEFANGQENPKMTMTVNINLGKVYHELEDYENSISHFEKGFNCSHFKISPKANSASQAHKYKISVIEGDAYAGAYANWGHACLALLACQHRSAKDGCSNSSAEEANYHRSAKECLKRFEKTKFNKNDDINLVETYTVIGVVYREVACFYRGDAEQVEYHKSMEKSIEFLKKSLKLSEHQIHNLKDRDHFKISIVDTFIESYKQLTVSLIKTRKTKKALSVCDSGRARALRDRFISKYGLSNQNAARSYSLRYSSIVNLLKKGNFFVLFHALTQDIHITMSVLPNQQQPICSLENDSTKEGQMEQTFHEIVNSAYNQILPEEKEGAAIDDSTELDHNNPQGEGNMERTTDLVVTRQAQRNAKKKSAKSREKVLKTLFDRLVAPTLNQRLHHNLEEIVVIPDGPLNRVPYAALIDQSGKYLSETFRIRLAPSLTTLKILQECPKSNHCATGALVIGNPDVGKVRYKGKITEQWTDPLKQAEDEAKKIGELLNVKALLGSDATKDAVKEKLREGVAVIHIAAHGLEQYGEIVLAPSATAKANGIPDEQDYILKVKEVQDMGLRAQLVVLSCCSTGCGDIKAEGVIGMSRAFLAAGTRAVVATLWDVNDEATCCFMGSFYSYLKKGHCASSSLQQAMTDLRMSKDYSEPYFWAPFFLMGDNVTVKL